MGTPEEQTLYCFTIYDTKLVDNNKACWGQPATWASILISLTRWGWVEINIIRSLAYKVLKLNVVVSNDGYIAREEMIYNI